MAQKFKEAEKRIFHRIHICMNCGGRMRADPAKVKQKKENAENAGTRS